MADKLKNNRNGVIGNNAAGSPKGRGRGKSVKKRITNGRIGESVKKVGTGVKKVGNKVKKANDKKKFWFALGFILIVVIIAVVVIVVINNTAVQERGDNPEVLAQLGMLSDENKEETTKVMDEIVEMNVGEYVGTRDITGGHGMVPITIKNKSDQKTSIAIDLALKDQDGHIIDQTSVYAEEIAPGETYEFQTFVYSKVSESVFRASSIEVYRAYTYKAPGSDKADGDESGEQNGASESGESGGTSESNETTGSTEGQ